MEADNDSAVVGLDIGSSKVKACLFDLSSDQPELLDDRSEDCPLRRPEEGWAEHDLGGMLAAVEKVLEVAPAGSVVGWSSAMHALVLLDGQGRPLADAISWADVRSAAQAQSLRESDPEAYQRTGTPLHPMAWPAKLAWVREHWPERWKATARVTDLKSYLWEALTGERAPLDRSSASGTGLWNSYEQEWDAGLRSLLEHVELPAVGLGHRLEWKGRELFLGSADGPLGNLGLGAVDPTTIALSLGTSGAVRRFVEQREEVTPGLFLYALDDLGWVKGGAISNGASVLDWLQTRRSFTVEQIMEQVRHQEPGANGVTVYPYFSGERAPFWHTDIRPLIRGEAAFDELARAALEGVAYCLRRLLELLGPARGPVRCTGGLFHSLDWAKLFANVSGRELNLGSAEEATALGAALLTREDALERARRLPCRSSIQPDPETSRLYDELYDEWLAGDPATLGNDPRTPGPG